MNRTAPNIGRDGIYLPPSMLKTENTLLFVAFDPIPSNLPPLIRAVPDSGMPRSLPPILQL